MSKRDDAVALLLLLISAFGSAVIAFVVQAALARTLKTDDYGHFASALAAITVVAPAVGFGLSTLWLKLYGAEGWAAVRWMPASARFVILSSSACLFTMILWAEFGARDQTTSHLILWMLPAVLSPGAIELASAKFQLEERFGLVAAWQGFQHLMRLSVVLVCYLTTTRVDVVAIGFGCVGLLVISGALVTLTPLFRGKSRIAGHGHRPLPDGWVDHKPLPRVGDVWHSALPFGLTSVLYFSYVQGGLIMVALLTSPGKVAQYNVALTILNALYLFPTVLFQKLLMPRLHRWAAAGDVRMHRAYRLGNSCMLWAGLAAGGATALLAPVMIPLLFSKTYESAVPLLVVLAACVPLRFLTASASSIMTGREHIQTLNGCIGIAFLWNTFAGFLLIPRFGLIGATYALVSGEALWTLLVVLAANRIMRGRRGWATGAEAGPVASK
jgi:O-antigen/teichoic acid export membrane protein